MGSRVGRPLMSAITLAPLILDLHAVRSSPLVSLGRDH